MIASLTRDVTEALRANPAALSRFEALPPSHRNEYLKWTAAVGRAGRFRTDRTERKKDSEVKRDDTRERRIAGMIDRLMNTESAGVPRAVGRTDGLPSSRTERGAS